MTSRPSTLRLVLSVAACSVVLVACGNGLTFGIAPGGPPPPEPVEEIDAGPQERPDTGPPPVRDAGPQPDAGTGCTTTVTPLAAEDDLAEFVDQGIHLEFGGTCGACHNTSDSPTGTKDSWGPTATTEDGWFEAVTTLLARPDQVGLAPTETTLFGAFAGTFAVQKSFHPEDPTAMAAVEAWMTLRNEGITETVCTDAGPGPGPGPGPDAGPGPGPGDCTPTIPSAAEGEARFHDLAIGEGVTAGNCQLCHATAGDSATGDDLAWGSASDDPAGWYSAFAGKAAQESVTDIEQSSLYIQLTGGVDGTDASHNRPAEAASTLEWLDYITNGEVPAGCP